MKLVIIQETLKSRFYCRSNALNTLHLYMYGLVGLGFGGGKRATYVLWSLGAGFQYKKKAT